MKKNVALCYSGQLRDVKKCLHTHIKHIIEPNCENYNFFVFVHSWHDPSLDGQSYWEGRPERGSFNDQNLLEIFEIRPDSIMLDRPIQFNTDLEPDPRFKHPIQNTLSMFFSIQKCSNVMMMFSRTFGLELDFVFRMRTDLYFFKDIVLSEYNENKMHINGASIHTPYAIRDTFAFGPLNSMITYFDTFSHINEVVKDGCAVNPECILGFYLNKNNIELDKSRVFHNIYYKLGRDV